VFLVPGSNPPQTIPGLAAFCRVTATLTPASDSMIKIELWLPVESAWNGRFLGTGGLVTWVKKGTAPETITAIKFVNDTPPAVQMTRPLCVYPKVAKYNGSGSTSIAANFTCVTDERDFNQKPAPQFGP
jgi:hypothetical protein